MIKVSSRIKAAFQSDSMNKRYFIRFLNEDLGIIELTNEQLSSDSITITENLCSEEQLHYGRCEANMFEYEIKYDPKKYTGEIFDVFLILGEYDDEPFTVGRYIVDSEEVSNDRQTKSITAYDIMYILNVIDVTYWYYTDINFPITVKQFRNSLLEYVGQNQETVELINDNMVMTNSPWDGETDITFEAIMTSILEINGVFGSINRQGKFDYISLDTNDQEETYPEKNQYPSSTLFPKSIRGKNYFIDPHLIKSDIYWENYMCKTVDTIQARSKSGAVLKEYHIPEKTTYTNIYVIKENPLIDAFEVSVLENILYNFANKIKKVSYKPCTASIKMDLSLEVGDAITLTSTDGTRIPTYILTRTMEGIVHAFDEIEATGYEEFINEAPSTDGAISEMMDDLMDLDDRLTAVEDAQASGDGTITILSVKELPASPKRNVLYLVQGRIYVQ